MDKWMRFIPSVADVEAGWEWFFTQLEGEDSITGELAIPLEMPSPAQLTEMAKKVKGLCCGSSDAVIWVESEEKYYYYLASFGH